MRPSSSRAKRAVEYSNGKRVRLSARAALIVATSAILLSAPSADAVAEGWLERLFAREEPSKPAKAEMSAPPSARAPQPWSGNRSQGDAQPQAPREPAPAAKSEPGPKSETAEVPVVVPKVQTLADFVVIPGNAAALMTAKMVARVEGYLEKIHVGDGALVKKGDLLFTIQQDQYLAQLQQAQAQVAAQQAAVSYARTEVARYGDLVKKNAATQVEVDKWVFQQQSAEAQLQAAQAQVALAKLNLTYTEVRAPFDGIMGKHLVDPGNVVGGAGQQTVLAEVQQLDPIYVVVNLGEQDLLKIRANLGQRRLSLAELVTIPVDVALSNEAGFPHRGTLEYVAPAIDPATGTLLVRAKLPNSDRALLPGAFARIKLPMERVEQNALLVPDAALGEDQGGRYLLVLNKDDIVEKRYVQSGILVGNLRVIATGLTKDDRVVVSDFWRASPGTKVTPKLTAIEARP